ncbi:hypothetical protein Tco_0504967 [Tanacetum coccineum]
MPVQIHAHQCLIEQTLNLGNKGFVCIVWEKDNGENIMNSVTKGPFQMGTMRDTLTEGGEGALHLGPERARVFADLSAEQKDRYKADIRATNIILQGDQRHLLSQSTTILTPRYLGQCEDDSGRFTKLINDMRNIKMTMPRMQLNSKFVNNMLPEWSRFITEVKLNRGLKESNFDQLYAYLKQHEYPNTIHSDSSIILKSNHHLLDNVQLRPPGSTSTDNLIESLTNTLALLNQSYKSHLPQTNNQLRTSSNARNKATVQDGWSCEFKMSVEDTMRIIKEDHFRGTMQEKML